MAAFQHINPEPFVQEVIQVRPSYGAAVQVLNIASVLLLGVVAASKTMSLTP